METALGAAAFLALALTALCIGRELFELMGPPRDPLLRALAVFAIAVAAGTAMGVVWEASHLPPEQARRGGF